MDFEFLGMFVKLILALGVTLGLMFLSFKLMGTKLNAVNNNKYVKVIERVQVTKENSILIVKAGKKGYVMTSTAGHMEKLSELSQEEIDIIEEVFCKSSFILSISKSNSLAIPIIRPLSKLNLSPLNSWEK